MQVGDSLNALNWADDVRLELDRILQSESFRRSPRLSAFLQFVVTQTLEGRGDSLKEQVLAHELYGRSAGFDGSVDPIVRVDARRLRDKLREYYSERQHDPVVITLPKGAYLPVFSPASPVVAGGRGAWIQTRPLVSSKLVPFALLAATVLALAGAGVWLWVRPAGQTEPPVLLPLTSYEGEEGEPSISPNGLQVAFSWNGQADGDNFDVYVKQVDSDAKVRLTTDPAPDGQPAWSPDGRRIAFVRAGAGIFVVAPLGGAERQITSSGRSPAWSADGEALYFSDRAAGEPCAAGPPAPGGEWSIFRIELATGETRRITCAPAMEGNDHAAVPSPDGKLLAIERWAGPDSKDLFLSGPYGEKPRRLTHDQRNIGGFAWTPDSTALVVSSPRASVRNLWRVAVRPDSSASLTVIGEAGTHCFWPTISHVAKGKPARLVFERLVTDFNIRRAILNGAVHAVDPIQTTPFAHSTTADYSPDYSPDGSKAAIVSKRSGYPEIWVCDSSGSRCLQVTTMRSGMISQPRWSPNGKDLVFIAPDPRSGRVRAAIVDERGSIRFPIAGDFDQRRASWSRDGTSIYFASRRSGRFEIWRTELRAHGDASSPVQITRNGGLDAVEDPSGGTLYYVKQQERELWKCPSVGGPEILVSKGVEPGYWTFVEDGILYVPFSTGESTSRRLMLIRHGIANPKLVGTLDRPVFLQDPGISASSDGRYLLFGNLDSVRSDLMLLEDFR